MNALALTALLAASIASAEPPPDPAATAFFESKVRPLLIARCYSCHSADAKKLRGGLRLDTPDGLRRGGDSGPAVVPGYPEKSLLVKAVRHGDDKLKMPPDE